MRFDLNLLPIFVALMEERSVTRAAERVGMTQPALSNALARLRAMLQDPLFVRERYGLKPTPIALDLAPIIAEALAKLDDAVLGQQEFDPAKDRRLVTIAPNDYVELTVMPAIVAELERVAPELRLRLLPYGNDLVETGVVSGTTALVIGRVVDPPDNLVVQHLLDDGLACVVRADHPSIGGSITTAQFERLRHVNIVQPGRMRAGLFQPFEEARIRREVAISVTNFFAAAEMVAVTDYCTTLPRLFCRRLQGDHRVKVLPPPVDLGTFPVEMAWHMRYRQDPAHCWLRSFIGQSVAKLGGGRSAAAMPGATGRP